MGTVTGSTSLFLLSVETLPILSRLQVKVKVLVAQCPTLCDPMDCSRPGSSAMEFSRREYWSGLPSPSSEDLPNPGIKPGSPALQADSLPSEPPRKPKMIH